MASKPIVRSRGKLALDYFDWFFIVLIFAWVVLRLDVTLIVGFYAVYLLLDIRTHIIRGPRLDAELQAPSRDA